MTHSIMIEVIPHVNKIEWRDLLERLRNNNLIVEVTPDGEFEIDHTQALDFVRENYTASEILEGYNNVDVRRIVKDNFHNVEKRKLISTLIRDTNISQKDLIQMWRNK